MWKIESDLSRENFRDSFLLLAHTHDLFKHRIATSLVILQLVSLVLDTYNPTSSTRYREKRDGR